jgi:hypothetical protein
MSEEYYLKAIRDFYSEHYDGGKYKRHCVEKLIALTHDELFLQGLHDCMVRQLGSVNIGPFGIDKMTILFPVSRTSASRIKDVLVEKYKSLGCSKIEFGDCRGGYDEGVYFKNHIILRWIDVDSSISVFFDQKDKRREHNIKVSFNFSKHREQALNLLCLIIENVPPSLVGHVFKNARVNEFEQYIDFKDIPSFLFFIGKGQREKDIRVHNYENINRLVETIELSKDKSREVKVYDKTKERVFTGRDKTFYKKNGIVTRLEVTIVRNKLNSKDRENKLKFAQWKSYTKFTDSLKMFSPILMSELSEPQIRYILTNGFHTFYLENKVRLSFIFEKYSLEYERKFKNYVNSLGSIQMGGFILDLGKMVEVDIIKLGYDERSGGVRKERS